MGWQRSSRFATFAAVVASAAVGSAQDDAVLARAGKHFAVYLHRGAIPVDLATRIATDALAAAEATFPIAERLLLVAASKPSSLFVYADEKVFRLLEQQHTGAKGHRESFVRLPEQEAHLLLWPVPTAAVYDAIGLPPATRAHVVLAAAQLLAARKFPAAVKDPWLAEVFGYAVVEGKQAQQPKYGVDPVFDSRRWWHCGSKERSLRSWVLSAERPADRVAAAHAEEAKCLTAQLVAGSSGDWARRWLAAPASPTATALQVREAAVERLLGTDWPKIESRWQKQNEAIAVPFFVRQPIVAVVGKGLVMAGTAETTASLEVRSPPPEGAYRLAATATLPATDGDGLRFQLDWDGKSLVGVFLRKGQINVCGWREGFPWDQGQFFTAPIAPNRPFDVVIAVDATRHLLVSIDGVQCADVDLASRDMHGDWSVATNDGPIRVEGLRCEPLAPRK